MSISLYRVNKSYCAYLHEFDSRVPEVKEEKETRPFIRNITMCEWKEFFCSTYFS